MAGFRIGRGRDNRTQQQPQRQQPQRQQPQQQPYGGQQAPPHPQYGQQQWPQTQGQAGYGAAPRGQGGHGNGGYGGGGYGGGADEPEYFGDPHPQGGYDPRGGGRPPYGNDPYGQDPHGRDPYGQGGHPQGSPAHDPYANNPGHTQAFSVNEDPYGDGNTYRAGNTPAPPAGPRLHWKQLLSGIVLRPGATFWQTRDHQVWVPALIVTFLYGLLAVFGFDKAREETINSTFASAIPYVLTTSVAMIICGLILGVVTHTLARQLGGDGSWQPTVGLSMLIMSLTDAPRLLFALFLGGDNSLVQIIGWVTWLAAGALFTSMVSKSHDLPWPKALGASAIQLVALLSLLKLGTI
ncbi:YIP1 family protein [Streptomyces sp. NPDC091272]|uniref:Yip1 family protein n=1 Tax=Streptomyces sp. NPDC091272 TaxID=3365981 RepID=UPI00380AC7D1